MTVQHSIILDIGAHHGDDSAFYLKKGFRVLAVDADPKHVERCRGRFAAEIAAGRYEIVHAAIADRSGQIAFYVNLDKDDWSSTDPRYGTRDGTRFEQISVPSITIAHLLNEYAPESQGKGESVHYLKSDIEGGDVHVLEGLLKLPRRPKYMSFEAHDLSYFAFLRAMGYKRFKLVNQNLNWRQVLPNPPLEGVYVEHQFGEHSSGPFGAESPGEWLSFENAVDLYRAIRNAWAIAPGLSNAWYDIHVAWGE